MCYNTFASEITSHCTHKNLKNKLKEDKIVRKVKTVPVENTERALEITESEIDKVVDKTIHKIGTDIFVHNITCETIGDTAALVGVVLAEFVANLFADDKDSESEEN